jgi:light-regulated signal transduction histidine kinase (bacteriophytochrome)
MTDSLVEANANIEQKRVEVEEQKKLLEKANQELDSFAYTASHDLRAPLRGIASFSSFLEEDYKDKLDEQGLDYLREIREGTDRMNDLIEDLLTLSRISRVKNPYEDVGMNELIASIMKRIQFDIKEHNVKLEIQKDIPIVRCDRIKMGEVFLNLVNNAIKFSSKNNENPKVEIGYSDKDKFHEFYVKDNGIGIDPKYNKEIFGIFKRLHKASEYEGTGAGLSIVKRVINDHEGDIWIESELGKGAAFYFTIPKIENDKADG